MPSAAETRDGRSARDPGAGAAVAAARALVFAAAGTALALCAHHLSSGHAVLGWSVPLAAGTLFLLALPLARIPVLSGARRRGALPVVLTATGIGQAALHQLFAAVQNGTAAAPPALHPHGTGPGIHQAWHADHHLAVVMAAGHTVAALLVGWCMQRADASCRTVARHLGHTLDRWLGRPAPAGLFPERRPRTGPVRAWSPPSPYNRTALNHTVVRRGPPATH
ncbi:hypothetical protein ACPCB7_20010 [Streptomyces arboris]|uniref:hypothetical protein n=1 Tax=Streptomyces arboris TaxID=2600619 RepID=UPI003C2AF1DF